VFKRKYRILNNKFRTVELKENTSKFDIPCSIFCNSFKKIGIITQKKVGGFADG